MHIMLILNNDTQEAQVPSQQTLSCLNHHPDLHLASPQECLKQRLTEPFRRCKRHALDTKKATAIQTTHSTNRNGQSTIRFVSYQESCMGGDGGGPQMKKIYCQAGGGSLLYGESVLCHRSIITKYRVSEYPEMMHISHCEISSLIV